MRKVSGKAPVTAAVRFLRVNNVDYSEHLYVYEDRGGTSVSARELGISEHSVIKTLILESFEKKPLLILMHGDRQVSTKRLARLIGTKSISPCAPLVASRHTGYLVGGTSPFGTKRNLPIYVEESIFDLDEIYINGGARGFLVRIEPEVLKDVFSLNLVNVAI